MQPTSQPASQLASVLCGFITYDRYTINPRYVATYLGNHDTVGTYLDSNTTPSKE